MIFSVLKRLSIAIIAVSAITLITTPAYAADPKHTIKDAAYAAKFVSQSVADPVEIEAGTTKTVVFKFKNVGTATWNATGKQFVSAYTIEPRYRDSLFKGSNWIAPRQTGKIEGTVKPGETGTLTLELTAPQTPGLYKEEFYLSAENYSWVKGGYFYLDLTVVPKKQTATIPVTDTLAATTPTPVVQTTSINAYQGKQFILSKKQIEARGGEVVSVISGVQNTGTSAWNNYTLKVIPINAENKAGKTQIVAEKNESIAQWGIARDTISISLPQRKGVYLMRLSLNANNAPTDIELATITVTITEDAENITEEEYTAAPEPVVRMSAEPRIRVGIWKDPTKGVEFISTEDSYQIYNGETLVGTLPQGTRVSMWQSKGIYYFKGGEFDFSTANYIRLVPTNNVHAVFRLTNYERLVSYRGKLSFNAYRGAMEYRTTNDKKSTYVINDLLIEDYVAGIAETSNEAHMEYIKALLTAARSYAFYMQNHNSGSAKVFDVVATTADQLYLGYESEVLMPRVVEGTQATRGLMITYDVDSKPETQSEVVIAPYYANSDGRTRSWSEVWGGVARPWLVSVVAEFDKRDKKVLYGHGVGMSARDASFRASEKQENFEQLIKYYYTGVSLERMYK